MAKEQSLGAIFPNITQEDLPHNVPNFAKMTLELKSSNQPKVEPHQLVITIKRQSAGASKRLYTRYFKSNPTVRAILKDSRVPFKNWTISRQYTVKVCP